jgi:lipoate-protein ligase A
MNSIEHQIYSLRRDGIIHMLSIEAQNTNNPELKLQILNFLQKQSNVPEQKDSYKQFDDLKNKMQEASLKNKWTKLSHDEKLNRLEHYFNKNLDKEFKKSILELFNSNKLKASYVEYDSKEGMIANIKKL